ncbi:S-layer homology domain-containing protein [Brachybacterium sp. JHP9]|uniref:S-layer homology domain-containing protein n=1 Tax=Brachybacterium equifaecis TaxID=2910770 RepID=A0ABT0R1D6_9MICO|nr:S-layer homology domain-containing protein [Brachybacterium equifaecis]MCL6423273.1 S-layer homology domain-containing protein [Brachybacterium equifaecis]
MGTGPKPTVVQILRAGSPFTDIKEGDEHFDAVLWAYNAGIAKGYPDYTYRPLAPVNRDAMAAFLHRMAGSPAVTLPRTEPFTDITKGDQHYEAVIWAYQNAITTGYPDRTFRPTEPIARNAMAAFLYRYAGSPATAAPTTAPFADVPAGSAFAKEIAWLKERGIAKGWADGTFRPYSPMNRDATAAFIQRVVVQEGVKFRKG